MVIALLKHDTTHLLDPESGENLMFTPLVSAVDVDGFCSPVASLAESPVVVAEEAPAKATAPCRLLMLVFSES